MTHEDVLARIDDSMLAFAGDIAACGGKVTDFGDCKIVRSPIPFMAYSGAFSPRFGGSTEQQARDVRAKMKELGVPPIWQLLGGVSPSDLAARLIGLGAERIVEVVCMWGEPGDLVEAPDVSGIEVRPCENESDVEVYARLYPLLFDAPVEDWIEQSVAAELLMFSRSDDRFRRWLAWDGDTPIAAGMVLDCDGTAVLATLLTLPECRNRGIGASLMARALQDLFDQGCSTMSVVAGPGADRLYARMGFKEVGRGAILVWE